MDNSEALRASMDNNNSSQFSPSVMQHKAIQALASENWDSLFDLEPDQIAYFSFIRAVNEKLPIPATMAFINSLMSLSRSKDRKGRLEYAQTLTQGSRPVFYPTQVPGVAPLQAPPSGPGILSRILNKKGGGDNV